MPNSLFKFKISVINSPAGLNGGEVRFCDAGETDGGRVGGKVSNSSGSNRSSGSGSSNSGRRSSNSNSSRIISSSRRFSRKVGDSSGVTRLRLF